MSRNVYIEGTKLALPHPFRRNAENLALKFDTDTVKIEGVIRWKSNNHVPPQEVLDFWKFIGKRFNMQKSIAARKKDDDAFFANYRANQQPVTAEQRNEMTAAFGKGATVVNAITGQRTQL